MIDRPLNIGIVSPYGWDAPGGVQAHIADLRDYLVKHGHSVSVLAPTADEDSLPDWVESAGRPISIPYNGAVARVLFGPIAFNRVKQWITEKNFDLLHLHEPAIPSLSLLACSIAEGPMVGTFHVAAPKQRAAFAVAPVIVPIVEKLRARIAVSEEARRTLTDHIDTDAVVIPNGIDANFFARANAHPEWRRGSTIGFLGRFDEVRKGLPLLLEALPKILKAIPNLELVIAGPGDKEKVLAKPLNFLAFKWMKNDSLYHTVDQVKEMKKVKNKYQKFRRENILIQDEKPAYYIYRQVKEGNTYVGIIAVTSIDDYINGVIKIHEQTLTKREEKLKEYLDVCEFNAEPVLFFYPADSNNTLKFASFKNADSGACDPGDCLGNSR